ncbi:MAG: hypothetical protein HC911_17020, partial [Chloroflexaceae bacterium]|nr:hypothetical protein [Chloroflexaceae bacterium]
MLAWAMGDAPTWIELYNPADADVDVTGWQIYSQSRDAHIELTTTAPAERVSIPARGWLVIEFTQPFLNSYAGDTVKLYDRAGDVINSFTYTGNIPARSHARIPDGSPQWHSDQMPSPGTANIPLTPLPEPTATATELPPVPSSTEPITPPELTASITPPEPTLSPVATPSIVPSVAAVVINELLTGDGSGTAWIELYNISAIPIDISEWRITSFYNSFRQEVLIPPDTIIPPFGFAYFLVPDQFIPNQSGVLVLQDGRNDVSYVDRVEYPPLPSGAVYARERDGAPLWRSDYPPSPGAPNLPPPSPTPSSTPVPSPTPTPTHTPTATPELILVYINELNPTGSEWLELYNPADTPVTLTDWTIQRSSASGPTRMVTLSALTLPGYGYAVIALPAATLPDSGATVLLRDSVGRTVDHVSYSPPQRGATFARERDGAPLWRSDYPPSPGGPNLPPPSATLTATATSTRTAVPSRTPT